MKLQLSHETKPYISQDPLLTTELFGPVLTVYVYPDEWVCDHAS